MPKLYCTPCGNRGDATMCDRCGAYLCAACEKSHSDKKCAELKRDLKDFHKKNAR